jgi:hypothetical protein
MNFNFGEVLSRAWQIIWKHKVLWIFGIFAGCSRGGGGGGGGSSGGGNGPGTGPGQPFSDFERILQDIGQWINDNPWIVAVFVLLVLLVAVLSIFLGTIGRIALIKGTLKAEQGVASMSFGELFSESTPYFWRVFGLALLIGLVALLIFLPLILIGVLTSGIGFACIVPLFCLLIPVFWAVSVIVEQANVAIVLEDLGIGDGWRRGWEIARANVGTMILMALILFVGSGVVGFIIALPLLAAAFPFILGAATENASPIWIAAVCCAIYFPILLVLNGIVSAYMQTAWALTYMRVTKPQASAPVIIEANA